ncbi:hypothetical protein U3A55_13620 [Salarchaeum sp. III]|uniref:hypothetical protein n=1 Tax=Salarchaeum sp. III TaxID=3107927 RepID=UPI002EDAAD8E
MSRLVFARTVPDSATPLETALDADHTGRAVFEPQQTLLLDAADRLTLWFDDGVPTHARHSDGRTGGAALAAFANPGPVRVELHADPAPSTPADAAVAADAPATHLAGDDALAARTRDRTPDDTDTGSLDAVEAFLADDDAIADLRERAREEAERRANEWGFE